uniref:GYF domain-containing protein n=1 Tax=Parastrongyloides trichosuri TaxID=131310 RepID=A0A0N4ZVA9_PARTI
MSNGNIMDILNNGVSSRIDIHTSSSVEGDKNFVYSRDVLMKIKETPASNEIPDYLSKDFIDEKGVFSVESWMDHIWEVNGITNKNEGKNKKARQFPKKEDHSNFDTIANILSPQRKGFSSGCRAASPDNSSTEKKSTAFNSGKFKSPHDSFGKGSPLVGSESRRGPKEYSRNLDKDSYGRGKCWNTSDPFKPSFARNNNPKFKNYDRSQSDEEVPEWLDDDCDFEAEFELKGFDEDDDFGGKKNRNKIEKKIVKKESESDNRSRSGSVLSGGKATPSSDKKDSVSADSVTEYIKRLQLAEDKKDNNRCVGGLAGSRLSKFFVSNIERQSTNSPSPVDKLMESAMLMDIHNKEEGSENYWAHRHNMSSEPLTGESLLSKLMPANSQPVPNSPVRRIGNMELDANLRAKGVALEDVEKSMLRCAQEVPPVPSFNPGLLGQCPPGVDPTTFYKALMQNEVMGRAYASQNMQMKKMAERQNEIPIFHNDANEENNEDHFRRLESVEGHPMSVNMHPQMGMGMPRLPAGVPVDIMQKMILQQQMNMIFSQQAMLNPHHRQMVMEIRNQLIARAPELANNIVQLNIATAQVIIARQSNLAAAERLRNAQLFQQQHQNVPAHSQQQQSSSMYYQGGGSPYNQQIKKNSVPFATSNNTQDSTTQSKLNSFVPTSVIRQMHKSGQCNNSNSNSGRASNSQTPTNMLSNNPLQQSQQPVSGMINEHSYEDQRKYSDEHEVKPDMKSHNIPSMSDLEKAKLQTSYNNVLHAMTSGLPMQGWKMTNNSVAGQAFLAQQTLMKSLTPAQQMQYINSLRIKQQQQQLAASYRTGINQPIPGMNMNLPMQPGNSPLDSFNPNAQMVEPNANYVSPDANIPNTTESGQIKASILMKLPPSAKPVSVEDLERELIQSSAK